jgi:hypothetical protein
MKPYIYKCDTFNHCLGSHLPRLHCQTARSHLKPLQDIKKKMSLTLQISINSKCSHLVRAWV